MFRTRATIVVLVAILAALLVPHSVAQAAAPVINVGGMISSGCNNAQSFVAITFLNTTDPSYTTRTIVRAGDRIWMDEQFNSPGGFLAGKTQWGLFDINSGGTKNQSWPLPAGVLLEVTITTKSGSTGATGSTSFQWDCGTGYTTATGGPLPNNANLQVLITDTLVFQSPDGAPVEGAVLKTCQSVFTYDTSEDGKWLKVFRMGGWIPADKVVDVPETYGQAGVAKVAGC